MSTPVTVTGAACWTGAGAAQFALPVPQVLRTPGITAPSTGAEVASHKRTACQQPRNGHAGAITAGADPEVRR